MATWTERARATGYVLGQRLVGGDRARTACLEALDLRAGERVLDIGCGPAYYLDGLPEGDYFGFDTNAAQIAVARARFGHRARFFAEPYAAKHQQELGQFDAVMLLGLLHHLDDQGARDLLGLVARSLRPDGRVVALDTPLHDGQSRLARFLAKNDRGDYVRRPEAFLSLAQGSFERVESRLLGDGPGMLSSFFMMTLSGPRST